MPIERHRVSYLGMVALGILLTKDGDAIAKRGTRVQGRDEVSRCIRKAKGRKKV